ncbi:hypothetical protein B0H13DRAFT_1851969 [Mycena leptocephala]|nr:hypothetical protein B0H13DRAFT_1851969 [Mycena leptocephala]
MPPKFDKILSKASRDQLLIAASDFGLKIGEGSTLKDLQKCVKVYLLGHRHLTRHTVYAPLFTIAGRKDYEAWTKGCLKHTDLSAGIAGGPVGAHQFIDMLDSRENLHQDSSVRQSGISLGRFTATMFGQLEEMSGDNDCLTVGCPNWSASGWSEKYFVAHFQEQLLGLRETESKIQENSPGTEYVNNWTVCDRVVVGIHAGTSMYHAQPNMFGDDSTGSKLESDIMGGWRKRICLGSTVAIGADFICGGDGPGVKQFQVEARAIYMIQPLDIERPLHLVYPE